MTDPLRTQTASGVAWCPRLDRAAAWCKLDGCTHYIVGETPPKSPAAQLIDRAVEAAAFSMYAAGPWGEIYEFADNGARCITDAHNMDVYRDLAREAIHQYLDALNDNGS